jgi:hypothetical protein
MLRLVRIDSKKDMFLGAGVGIDREALITESATVKSSKLAIDADLVSYFKNNPGCLWKFSNLRRIAQITALVHLLICVIIMGFNISGEVNDDTSSHLLKTMTTKTVVGWVGKSASILPPSRNLGPNPLHTDTNMTISNECKIPGDGASRSSRFNTRAFSFEVGEIDIRWMMFSFFGLSFLFQIYGSWDEGGYNQPLIQGNARKSHLVEYSVSASLMMVAMCAQVGVTDVHILYNVFSNTWACMIFGLLSDVFSEFEVGGGGDFMSVPIPLIGPITYSYKWIAHSAGWVTLITAGSVMVSNIGTFRSCFSGISIPDEIIAAISLEFVLFFIFGLVQVYTLSKKPVRVRLPMTLDIMIWYVTFKKQYLEEVWRGVETQRVAEYNAYKSKYVSIQKKRIDVACKAEFCYLILSLVAKVTLGGFVYISAAMRNT